MSSPARAVLGTISAIVMLYPVLLSPQSDVGKSPREVLNPKTVRQLTGQEQSAPAPGQQLAYLSGEVRAIHEQLQEMLSIAQQVSRDTQRITSLDARVDALEHDLSDHKHQQLNDPTHIAVLETRLDAIIATQAVGERIAYGMLAGVGSIIVAALIVFAKRWASRAKPPEWAAAEAKQQAAWRQENRAKLEEAASAAQKAFDIGNNINEKLASSGVRLVKPEE